MLRRDILGGTHETEMAGPADLACNPHTGLSFKIDCASAVFPSDGSHVSPRLNHTLGVSFSLANWAEPKNVDSSPPKSRDPRPVEMKARQKRRERIFYMPPGEN